MPFLLSLSWLLQMTRLLVHVHAFESCIEIIYYFFPTVAVRHQAFLALGAMAHNIQQKNPDLSESTVELLHAMLSYHTGKSQRLRWCISFADWSIKLSLHRGRVRGFLFVWGARFSSFAIFSTHSLCLAGQPGKCWLRVFLAYLAYPCTESCDWSCDSREEAVHTTCCFTFTAIIFRWQGLGMLLQMVQSK